MKSLVAGQVLHFLRGHLLDFPDVQQELIFDQQAAGGSFLISEVVTEVWH